MQLEQPRSGFRRQCHQCTDPNTADYISKFFAIGSPSENNVRKSAMNSKFCCKYDQNAFAQLHRLEEGRLLWVFRDFRLEAVLIVGVPGFRRGAVQDGGKTAKRCKFSDECKSSR